jgi:hypothetical protein
VLSCGVDRAPALSRRRGHVPATKKPPTKPKRRKRLQTTTTVQIAGELLGIGRIRAYQSARKGEIPTMRFGTAIRVPVAKLAEMLGLPVEEVNDWISTLEDE